MGNQHYCLHRTTILPNSPILLPNLELLPNEKWNGKIFIVVQFL